MRFTHVTPQLPPNIGGVADYAVILGRRVEEQTEGRVQSAYIQAGSKGGKAPDTTLPHKDLSRQYSPDALVQAVGAFATEVPKACVLLHYVGYGYQKRGCPLWLLQAVRELKREQPGVRLITMFHELYATGSKPWHSSFWLNPLQRYIAAEIARLSDAIMTNRAEAASWLRKKATPHSSIEISPIFSNTGEPEQVTPYEQRKPYAVLFGSSSQKRRLYAHHGDKLASLLAHTRIEKFIDVGPVPDDTQAHTDWPIEFRGIQPADEISHLLQHASFGLLYYSASMLPKSGVMAAYASHGVPVVLFGADDVDKGNLYRKDRHFTTPENIVAQGTKNGYATRISQRVRSRYVSEAHSRTTAQRLISLLENLNPALPCLKV